MDPRIRVRIRIHTPKCHGSGTLHCRERRISSGELTENGPHRTVGRPTELEWYFNPHQFSLVSGSTFNPPENVKTRGTQKRYQPDAVLWICMADRGGQANFFWSPQITNPQILWLIPQSKIRKFLKGIDQWEKRGGRGFSGFIRLVSLSAILAEIFKQIGAGPILGKA
jgi:hypothetical protein